MAKLDQRIAMLEQAQVGISEPSLPPEKIAEIEIAVHWFTANERFGLNCVRLDTPPNDEWSASQLATFFEVKASLEKLDAEI